MPEQSGSSAGTAVVESEADPDEAVRSPPLRVDNAGALAPWLAHRQVQRAAADIAAAVMEALGTEVERDPVRVLVVDQRELVAGDWTFQLLKGRIESMATQLDRLREDIEAATSRVDRAAEQSLDTPGGEPLDAATALRRAAAGTAGEEAVPSAEAGPQGTEESEQKGSAPSAPWDAAMALLALLRTDYAVAAVQVRADSSELATLTAAALTPQPGVVVEVGDLGTLVSSPTLRSWTALLAAREALAVQVSRLAGALSAVTGGAQVLSAQGTVEHVRLTLETLQAEMASWLRPTPDRAAPPLLTAVRHERLHGRGSLGITHVLYVSLDHLGGDVVTRSSVFGSSRRLTYLGGAHGSWLLLRTDTGALLGGGAVAPAASLTHDVSTGQAGGSEIGSGPGLPSRSDLGPDPLADTERWTRVIVLILLVTLTVLLAVAALTGLKDVLLDW